MANNLRLRREDYPAIGNILLISLKRDINDYTKEYKTINEEFIKELEEKINSLKDIVSYNVLQSNQKSHTKLLYSKTDILKDKATLLKQYAIKAGLDTSLIAKNIKNINSKNIEGVVQSFRDIIYYYSQNKDKLKAMPDNFLEDLSEKNNELGECMHHAHYRIVSCLLLGVRTQITRRKFSRCAAQILDGSFFWACFGRCSFCIF